MDLQHLGERQLERRGSVPKRQRRGPHLFEDLQHVLATLHHRWLTLEAEDGDLGVLDLTEKIPAIQGFENGDRYGHVARPVQQQVRERSLRPSDVEALRQYERSGYCGWPRAGLGRAIAAKQRPEPRHQIAIGRPRRREPVWCLGQL